MNLNLNDARPRKVKLCAQTSDRSGPIPPQLEVGKTYQLTKLVINSWRSDIYLKEAPEYALCTSMFEEVDGYISPSVEAPKKLKELFEKYHHFIVLVGKNSVPPQGILCYGRIGLSFDHYVELTPFQEKLAALAEDEAFTIGQKNSYVDLDVTLPYNAYLAKVHVFITKKNGVFSVYDSSGNGIRIIWPPEKTI